jgi:hypothetical protein
MLKKLVSVVLLIAIMPMATGCAYCKIADHVNEPKCVTLNDEINCAKTNIEAFIPNLLPLVAWLFSGAQGPLDAASIITALEHMGFQYVICAASALDDLFAKNPAQAVALVTKHMPASVLLAQKESIPPDVWASTYHQVYMQWRAKYPNLKVCTVVDGQKVCK